VCQPPINRIVWRYHPRHRLHVLLPCEQSSFELLLLRQTQRRVRHILLLKLELNIILNADDNITHEWYIVEKENKYGLATVGC
jgi:hypothetical protein